MLSRDACLTRVDRPPQPPIRANNFPEFREFHCEIIEISRLRYKSMSKEFIDELSTAHRRRVSSKWSRLKRERRSFEKIITNIREKYSFSRRVTVRFTRAGKNRRKRVSALY